MQFSVEQWSWWYSVDLAVVQLGKHGLRTHHRHVTRHKSSMRHRVPRVVYFQLRLSHRNVEVGQAMVGLGPSVSSLRALARLPLGGRANGPPMRAAWMTLRAY